MWTDLLLNSKSINSIFSIPPSLEKVRLKEINFIEDGASILLHAILSDYPLQPPAKWISNGYNKAMIKLRFIETSEVEFRGWGFNNIVSIFLNRKANLIEVKVLSEDMKLEFKCKWLDLSDLLAFTSNDI
jgi:Immunity protein 50